MAPHPPSARRRRELLGLGGATLLGLPALPGARAEPAAVIRHAMVPLPDGRPNYREEVLRLVLEKSRPRYGPFEMRFVGSVPQSRSFGDMAAGRLDVVAVMTDAARESSGLPVRICLYKGLLGLRVGLGLPAIVRELEAVRTLQSLRDVSLGLVHDWPDFAIQRAAGLQVIRLSDLASGVKRLKLGSFQLIPMGVVEAPPLAQLYGLQIVSKWALVYPTAFYFFAAPGLPQVAERLEHGFEIALRDGSFGALFARRIEPFLHAAQIDKRIIFPFANPLLPAQTPLSRHDLWHPAVREWFPAA